MIVLLAAHAVAAVAAPALARRFGRNALLVCALAPAAALVWALGAAGGVLDGRPATEELSWVPSLGLVADLRLDPLALVMVLLIAGIGVLVLAYSRWYVEPGEGVAHLAGLLTAFAAAMLGLVLADNLLLLYVFWELTSVTSFLLIGLKDTDPAARRAALHALVVTAAGGLAMLAGFVLLGQAAGTYTISELVADPPASTSVTVALVLVLGGAVTKSAQVPFHFWLPGAMAAPTPVSTYLHSATMVKAGVYLVARLAPAFAGAAVWRPAVLGLGVATMLVGGWRALRQHDLKLLLAYGTVSQLGFLVALLGAGTPEGALAGATLLLAHGAFKATLFLVVGIVDHQAHTRDIRQLDGLGRQLPVTAAVAVIGAASMAGLPPLAGFVAKEAAFEASLHGLGGWGPVVGAGFVTGSILTVAYSARFVWGAFATKATRQPGAEAAAPVARPALGLLLPAALLSGLSVAAGVLPAITDGVVGGVVDALHGVPGEHLALWHGLTPALGLSVLAVAGGALLFTGRARVERAQAAVARLPAGDRVFDRVIDGVLRMAVRTAAVLQSGSLPAYLGIILLTALAGPGLALALRTSLPDDIDLAASPAQAVLAIFVAVAAIGVAATRQRFPAVLLLGAVGYGVAALFLVQGAPDLALTQLLIETLAVVVFVLVLRHLPADFRRTPWRLGRLTRAVVAAGVGVMVTGFALVAAGARTAPGISDGFLERALPEAAGRNVVNVILVDFRGYDTLGEITVLTVVALGVFSLVVRRRSEDDDA